MCDRRRLKPASRPTARGWTRKRLVVIFYLVFGIVLALFLDHVLGLLLGDRLADPEIIEGSGWQVTTLLGVVLTARRCGRCLASTRKPTRSRSKWRAS